MDFITGLPLSGIEQADTIIVITDRLLKNIVLEVMVSITAKAIAEQLLNYFIRYYGLPLAIVSNRGP